MNNSQSDIKVYLNGKEILNNEPSYDYVPILYHFTEKDKLIIEVPYLFNCDQFVEAIKDTSYVHLNFYWKEQISKLYCYVLNITGEPSTQLWWHTPYYYVDMIIVERVDNF